MNLCSISDEFEVCTTPICFYVSNKNIIISFIMIIWIWFILLFYYRYGNPICSKVLARTCCWRRCAKSIPEGISRKDCWYALEYACSATDLVWEWAMEELWHSADAHHSSCRGERWSPMGGGDVACVQCFMLWGPSMQSRGMLNIFWLVAITLIIIYLFIIGVCLFIIMSPLISHLYHPMFKLTSYFVTSYCRDGVCWSMRQKLLSVAGSLPLNLCRTCPARCSKKQGVTDTVAQTPCGGSPLDLALNIKDGV